MVDAQGRYPHQARWAAGSTALDSQIDASSNPQESQVDLLPPARALVPAPIGATPRQRERLVR